MPSTLLFLLIATFLPLVGVAVLVPLGHRLGRTLAGWVALVFLILSFTCTVLAMIKWYEGAHGGETWGMGVRPILMTLNWLPARLLNAQPHLSFLLPGLYVDSLTIVIFATIGLIAIAVQLFSIGFQDREVDFVRFYPDFLLALSAVQALAMAGTLLAMLACWILTGLGVFRLSRGMPSSVAKSGDEPGGPISRRLRHQIAEVVGILGVLFGGGILLCKISHFSIPWLWIAAGSSNSAEHLTTAMMTTVGLCFFCGTAARCALFPLHVWLADSVSSGAAMLPSIFACVISATSGVYLLARVFPLLTPDARLFIAIIGVTTLVLAAFIAVAQTDLPSLIAWTAISQFGVVMLGIGAGSWIGAMFYFITSIFIIAMLFLASGSVIAAAGGQRDIRLLGGLWRPLPVTGSTMTVAILAMAGAPLLSKFYSQTMLLGDVAAFAAFAVGTGHRAGGYWLLLVLPTFVSLLTAFNMTQCWMQIFDGQPQEAPAGTLVREQAELWLPLLLLAWPVIIAGYAMNVPELLGASIAESNAIGDEMLATRHSGKQRFAAFDQAWPVDGLSAPTVRADDPVVPTARPVSPAAISHTHGRILALRWTSWPWIVGIAAAVGIHRKGREQTRKILSLPPMRWIQTWLNNGMFINELYDWTVVNLILGIGWIWAAICRRYCKLRDPANV